MVFIDRLNDRRSSLFFFICIYGMALWSLASGVEWNQLQYMLERYGKAAGDRSILLSGVLAGQNNDSCHKLKQITRSDFSFERARGEQASKSIRVVKTNRGASQTSQQTSTIAKLARQSIS